MPSKKAQILIRTSHETKAKLEHIAEKDKRSLSNLLEIKLEDYIDQYEKEHGCILIEETTPEPEDQKARMLAYNKKILEAAAQICRKEE